MEQGVCKRAIKLRVPKELVNFIALAYTTAFTVLYGNGKIFYCSRCSRNRRNKSRIPAAALFSEIVGSVSKGCSIGANQQSIPI